MHSLKSEVSASDDDAPAPHGIIKLWRDGRSAFSTLVNHLKRTGVGLVCAVGYFDPGNWGVDLQAGSQYGYKLLFIVLLSGIFATFLQIIATRLGVVTGRDLATHCRLLLHDRPKHKKLFRWLLFYPLYALAESAIVATDLAELIGSATALCLLFPTLPLWAGVLITASDVLALLAIRDPLGRRPVRLFECVIASMVFIVLICMAIIISRVGVNWGEAFFGFVPSHTVVESGALYTSIGIIGATVMPHGIFLGSHLATQDRLGMEFTRDANPDFEDVAEDVADQKWQHRYFGHIIYNCRTAFRIIPVSHYKDVPKTHADHVNPPYSFVRAHLYHGMIDIGVNLLGIAVAVNALIVILASAVFYYGVGNNSSGPASLFDAYDLLRSILGKGVGIILSPKASSNGVSP
ncbi:hypothetical protein NM688_g8459 [Phlebia brevispora]|uniref:Uncharacterized protein n=1 Tax=Phlebia brevispora TaxID=194682 RepID=A0ACC1RR76_9APHY|nr:hypothetical protein NM688_g8459 [Phlebia brevispora]